MAFGNNVLTVTLLQLLQRLLVIDHSHHLYPANARTGRRRNLGHLRSHGKHTTPTSNTPALLFQDIRESLGHGHLANQGTSTKYWSAIETNVAILAASIPSFKALAKRYAPALLGSSNRGGSDYKMGNHSGAASRSLSTNKLSKFHMMDKSRSGQQEVDIHGGGGSSHDRSASRTKNGHQDPYNVADNSSEEAIYLKRQPPPEGKIGVRTDINTFYEEA